MVNHAVDQTVFGCRLGRKEVVAIGILCDLLHRLARILGKDAIQSITGTQDKVCLDVGASTGGFTDCMLQNGAKHVCALDVGYGQLAWQLRNDPRVTVMERRNARFMEPAWFDGPFDFASIDVSFISLELILPPLKACLKPQGQVVALIKPQFEAGRGQVGKNGVVLTSIFTKLGLLVPVVLSVKL